MVALDTLFYVSARARDDEGRATVRLADSLEYGLVISVHPVRRDLHKGSVDFVVVDSVRLTREAFVAALRARTVTADDTARYPVLYTHGFGTSLYEAWQHSASSRLRSRGDQPWVVFAWPSIGSGVAIPTTGDPFHTAYRLDSASAASSRDSYARALTAVHEAVGGSRLMMVAHSLGGQLVGETLMADTVLRGKLSYDPLRALAFVSPDVNTYRFGDVIVPSVRPMTQRLVLYASSDDRVLFMSQVVNDSERAGRIARTRIGALVRAGLETVDMTKGAYADSPVIHAFGTRHALRRKSGALFDLVHIVGARQDPRCRELLGTAQRLETGVWRLRTGTLPALGDLARCSPDADAPR
jgi:esterase/lipase superfamily enzyme